MAMVNLEEEQSVENGDAGTEKGNSQFRMAGTMIRNDDEQQT